MTQCICYNNMFDDVSSLAFIKGKIYTYYIYHTYAYVSGTFLDFEGREYEGKDEAIGLHMFKHYFMDLDEYRDNKINNVLNETHQ